MNKELKLKIIKKYNPMHDDYHTGVRSVENIKTYIEALKYDDFENGDIAPDYTEDMVKSAFNTGKITVYSSYPIKQGVFITPSKMEAQAYAGQSGTVYSKEVSLEDVAWIDAIEGQYANESEYLYEQAKENNEICSYEVNGEKVEFYQNEKTIYGKIDGETNAFEFGTQKGADNSFEEIEEQAQRENEKNNTER